MQIAHNSLNYFYHFKGLKLIRILLTASLFTLSSCAWKGDFFAKDSSSNPDESLQRVGLDKEEVQKFSVQKDDKPTPLPVKVIEKKPLPQSSEKLVRKKHLIKPPKTLMKKRESPPKKGEGKSYPKNYPKELIKLNEQAKKAWDVFVPRLDRDNKIFLDIHYLGMTVGKMAAYYEGTKKINGKRVYHFHAKFKSAPFYSAIYELDDKLDTFVDAQEFLSVRYNLIQKESNKDVDDVQLYDRKSLLTKSFYTKRSDGKVKKKNKEGFIPHYSIDALSIVFFIQGLPLKVGDQYHIPVVNKGKVLVVKTDVEAYERIDTEIGKVDAIRVHALTEYTGSHLKSGDMTFWFSQSKDRQLLKIKAKIKLGSVTADIAKRD